MPALLALVVAMFSLESRPAPHASDLAPDAFSGADALSRHPRVRAAVPGPAGRAAPATRDSADLVETRFRALGLETSRQRFFTDVDGEEQELSNVIGRLRGRSDRQVVIMAHRDSAGRPGAASASGTAVLLELAQALDALDRTQDDRVRVHRRRDGRRCRRAALRRALSRAGTRWTPRWCSTTSARPSRAGRSSCRGRPTRSRASQVAARTVEAALRRETGVGGRVGVLARPVDAPGVAAHAARAGPAGALRASTR